MAWVTVVSMLALMEYVVLGALVGMARGKLGVNAPAVTGNVEFEKRFRVHQNTLEQLIVFLPGIWAFGYYISYEWAAGLGGVFILGRIVYARAYIKEPTSRSIGVALSMLPCWALVIGGLVGATLHLLG